MAKELDLKKKEKVSKNIEHFIRSRKANDVMFEMLAHR
jgi:hypothetical protein